MAFDVGPVAGTNPASHRSVDTRLIDENVLAANLSEVEKQKRYADWFANARLLAELTFYDPEFERLLNRPSNGVGCGSSCSTGR